MRLYSERPSGQLTTYAVAYFAKRVLKQPDLDIRRQLEVRRAWSFGSSGNEYFRAIA